MRKKASVCIDQSHHDWKPCRLGLPNKQATDRAESGRRLAASGMAVTDADAHRCTHLQARHYTVRRVRGDRAALLPSCRKRGRQGGRDGPNASRGACVFSPPARSPAPPIPLKFIGPRLDAQKGNSGCVSYSRGAGDPTAATTAASSPIPPPPRDPLRNFGESVARASHAPLARRMV